MKQQADAHRSDKAFNIGDWVFIKLQPYKQQSAAYRRNHKLSPLYFGPYQVEDRIGAVAYKLKLPSEASIHPVFHVSQLKATVPPNVNVSAKFPMVPSTPPLPIAVLDQKLVKRGRQAATKVLIQWSDRSPEEATWEYLFDIEQRYPDFNLVDKVL